MAVGRFGILRRVQHLRANPNSLTKQTFLSFAMYECTVQLPAYSVLPDDVTNPGQVFFCFVLIDSLVGGLIGFQTPQFIGFPGL